MTAQEKSKRKTQVGIVVSDKMKKTLVVDASRVYRHPRYSKVMRGTTRCYVHDEDEKASEGDLVRIVECRPLSKLKKWRLVEIVKQHTAERAQAAAEEEIKALQEEIHGKASGEAGPAEVSPKENEDQDSSSTSGD